MTDQETAFRERLAKGSDATFLREMIGYAAQRLMELETEALCGAGTVSAVRSGGCSAATATASGTGRPERAPWSCVSSSCAAALTFLASWSRAAQRRRRCRW